MKAVKETESTATGRELMAERFKLAAEKFIDNPSSFEDCNNALTCERFFGDGNGERSAFLFDEFVPEGKKDAT